VHISAISIADAWFQILYNLPDEAYRQEIQRGSFEKDEFRLQVPWLSIDIAQYESDFVPVIPPGCGIPAPTTSEYVEEYAHKYLLSTEPPGVNEAYTYGSRIGPQLEDVIAMLSATPQTNQASIVVGIPEDLTLKDPACLRVLDFKIAHGRLNLGTFWRSWDLWAGLPTNLGGIGILGRYVASFLDIPTGRMFAASQGGHIYGYQVPLVEVRTGRTMPPELTLPRGR
jgi:thymidylate synthase